MKRKLLCGERIMYVDAATPVNCTFAVTVRGIITEAQLRMALLKIQAKHPLLRAGIQKDQQGKPYFVSGSQMAEIPIRMVDRLSDHDWEKESQAEWKIPFDDINGPLARLVWLKSEQISDLMLVCAHCICDGTSFVALMREMLMLLDQPDQEIGVYPSFQSIQDLLPEAILANKKIILKAKVLSVLARAVLAVQVTKPKVLKGNHYLIHWKLDEETTAALLHSCRSENTTVYTALCVAFLDAFQFIKGAKARKKVICPVDIRRFVTEIKNDYLFAFAPTVDLSLDKDQDMDFWAKARKLKQDLQNKINKMKVYELLMVTEYFHACIPKVIEYLKYTEGSHDFTFSNMGRLSIPQTYPFINVETIYSPSVAFPWRNPTTIVASTFKGQIDFTFLSNDAFLDYTMAIAIKNKFSEVIQSQVAIHA